MDFPVAAAAARERRESKRDNKCAPIGDDGGRDRKRERERQRELMEKEKKKSTKGFATFIRFVFSRRI